MRSHANALPAPEVIGPGTLPDGYAPDLNGANIESTPITPSRSALDFWESREGMRVEVDDARVVGPSNSFGEQFVTTKPAQAATYRGGTEILAENAIPSGRVEVVPANGSNPGVDVGDVFAGATVGPVDYSQFGGYLIAATTLGTVTHNHLAPRHRRPRRAPSSWRWRPTTSRTWRPATPPRSTSGSAEGVVTNLSTPDVVALEEVQDNTGATDDGTVAADQTLTKLTDAIVAAGGPRYQWREIDPVDDKDGGQPGGNIRVVFLFNPSRVSFVDRGSSSVNRSTTGTAVVKSHGDPALTLSPGRIDPSNPVWTTSRKPLAGEFEFRGRKVFVIANHFNSKGGDQNADGRFQFPAQSSTVQRAGQAQVVHDFVGQHPRRRPQGRRRGARRPQRLPVQPVGGGTADRHGGRLGALDPDRPDRHPAQGPAVHLRVQRRLAGARPHPRDAAASATCSTRWSTSTPSTPTRPPTTTRRSCGCKP